MTSPTPHVLYAEDDADTRELVSYVLTHNNCKVTLADSFQRALVLAQDDSFDLFMIDNWMPGGSGIELCKKLREFDPTTPILFYSGAAFVQDKQAAFAAGAQAYLTKPADIDHLVQEALRLIKSVHRRDAEDAEFLVH